MPSLDECLWASAWPDLHKSCYLARVCPRDPPRHCEYYKTLDSVQVGPTCGLLATSLLLAGLRSPQQLLEQAQHASYTINGEMCNAKHLLELLVDNSKGLGLQSQLFEGSLNSDTIKSSLRNGACLLVPYDADVNHAPCLREGHKAHWALIVGHLVDGDDEFHVIARHGKTKNMAIWRLSELAQSNSNLFTFAAPKSNPSSQFKIPAGDLGGPDGLRDKAIIVESVRCERVRIR